jgi:class 3 adenylate cyclase/WD40 repeat protein/tRNA A-37 threonylcarbamoyl transferase component Bud32
VPTLMHGRYELLETLGAGGEARVLKALDRRHDRLVALKIRSAHDERDRAELLGEARILLAVPPHPALPLVREDFFERDSYVIAMDWVDGTDLAKLLRDRGRPGLSPSSVLTYLAQAAEALTHLHSQHPAVIHGDVKPANLILTRGGRVKLVDFGVSSARAAPRRRVGTAGYGAPELAAGGTPSRASDIYALAATAFALLTGSAPAGVLPSWEGVDPRQAEQLEAAIRIGMATDPARRPQTPGELVERLRVGWAAALPTGVVTFCFSDIEGSTALWEADPVAMAEALVRHDELITDCVEARGGRLIESMGEGDSTVSVFDSAPAALEAALAATRALAAEPWPGGFRIAVRFGLHTGEAEQRAAHYVGPNVNLAARLRGQADGGQIFVSSVTADLIPEHLPEGCELVDLGPHRLKGVSAPERIHALKGPGVSTPLPATHCPYRGLLAFEAEDRDFFVGREEVVQEIIGGLAPGRLLAIVGTSGCGKSSVLRAGVMAAVRAGEVDGVRRAVLMTPGSVPRVDIADAPDVLVVVDQFEELFTLCDDPAVRDAFIDALLSLRGPVAIGLRADLYGRLGAHGELARAVAGNQVPLGAMSDSELERAVTEPARLAGLRLETGLVDLVKRDVAREPGALPLLSHALRATWERRDGRTLTVEGYRASGGVGSALAQTADSVVDALPEEGRHLARSVFLRLTEVGEHIEDTRRRVSIDELVPDGSSPDPVHTLLEQLAGARLVTLGAGTAEVAHEVLIREWPTLREWLDQDREGIRLQRQLGAAARLWADGGRVTSDLYRGARLAAAVDLARRQDLNATERAFIDAGVAHAERERRVQMRTNRRLRSLLAGASVLLVVAAGAGVLFFVQRSNARDAESAAEMQALRSDAERLGALALAAPNLERSMLLAVAGVDLQNRAETRSNLLVVLQRNPAALRVLRLSDNEVTALAASPDDRLLATGDRAGVIRFTGLRTWKPAGAPARLSAQIAVPGLRFSPDGRTLAVVTRRADRWRLDALDVATRRVRRLGSWRAPAPLPAVMSVAYGPGGHRLVAAISTFKPELLTPVRERLMMLDASTGRPLWQREYPMRPGQWEPRALFAGVRTLITSAPHGQTIVWNARTGQIKRRFAIGGVPALSSERRRLALALNSADPGNPSSRLVVLDLRSGRRTALASGLASAWIDSLAFTSNDRQIVASAFDGTHVWDVASGAISATFTSQSHGANQGLALDSRGTAITASRDGSITAWDVGGARRIGRTFRWNTSASGCPSGACTVANRQGTVIATVQIGGTTALIDPRTMRLIDTLPARNGPLSNALAFLPDGRTLVTGGSTGRVTLWDVQTHDVVRTLRFGEPVENAAVSPDGRTLAVQTQRENNSHSHVEVRELASGETTFTRTVRYGRGGLTFTHDGRELIALGCCDPSSTVVAWDARTGVERFQRAIPEHATALDVSPDSRILALGLEDGRVLFWDPRTGRQRAPALQVAAGNVSQLSFAPQAHMVAVGDADGTATVWDIDSRKRVGEPFPISTNLIPAVLFEPNGRLFITELGAVTEWPLDVRSWERFACRVANRDITREEWKDLLPSRPYRGVCPRP